MRSVSDYRIPAAAHRRRVLSSRGMPVAREWDAIQHYSPDRAFPQPSADDNSNAAARRLGAVNRSSNPCRGPARSIRTLSLLFNGHLDLEIRIVAANGGFTQVAASPSLAAADITAGRSRHSAGSAERLRCRRQASPLFYKGGCQEKKLLLRVGAGEIRMASSPTSTLSLVRREESHVCLAGG